MRYEYCLYLITRRPGTLRWRQRLAGVAVKLRTPKYVYSHVWVGGVDAAADRRFQVPKSATAGVPFTTDVIG